MVMEENWVKCDICKSMIDGNASKVACFFQGQPQEVDCPYKKQPVSEQKTAPHPLLIDTLKPEQSSDATTLAKEPHGLSVPVLPGKEPPSNVKAPPATSKPRKRRGVAIFLLVVIILLLAGSGVLADYTLRLHSQILSLNSKISTQANTIQYQSTVIQRGQVALAATNQAQSTVIQNGQATQTALAQQVVNLQATSTAVGRNTPLGATPEGQTPSPYPTARIGQPVFITFTLINVGTAAWSNQGGFSFNCTSNNPGHSTFRGWIPICPSQDKLAFINGATVSIGQSYTFSFYLSTSSLSAGRTYVSFWRLAYNGLLFGAEMYMQVTITG